MKKFMRKLARNLIALGIKSTVMLLIALGAAISVFGFGLWFIPCLPVAYGALVMFSGLAVFCFGAHAHYKIYEEVQ